MSRPPLPPSDDALGALIAQVRRQLPDAPAPWIEAATSLFRPAPAPLATPTAEPLLPRLLAFLRFDSWAAQPMPALRTSAAAARQLLFTAGPHDVDLRIGAPDARGRSCLLGQVLGPGLEGAQVLLDGAAGEATTAARPLDELGEFAFDDLPAGRYRLRLRLAGTELELPPVPVGPTPDA